MNKTTPEARDENRHLRKAVAEVKALLADAEERLRVIIQDEAIMAETPIEAQAAIESAAEAIGAALPRFKSIAPKKAPSSGLPDGPTSQQGQPEPPSRPNRFRRRPKRDRYRPIARGGLSQDAPTPVAGRGP